MKNNLDVRHVGQSVQGRQLQFVSSSLCQPRHIVQISKMADAGKGARSTEAKGKEKQKKLRELVDQEEYILRKRLPRTFPKRPNDVYISKKTNFKAQMIRCQTFLDNGNKVYIHALGAAINRAVNLALQLKANGCGSVEISTNTSTVYLTDDLEPTNDKLEYETLTRTNSAIHIKVYRPPKLKD